MPKRHHRRTDPACHYHREPRGWWSRLRYDRARGRSCDLCMRVRALANNPAYARFPVWADMGPGERAAMRLIFGDVEVGSHDA